MSNSLKNCIELKEELDQLRPLSSDDEQRIMQKFRLDWNYHSNHLEGNSLSYGETKALILFGITAQGKPLKDHFEITGHNEAINWILEVVDQGRPLTENFIRELHKLILKEPYEIDTVSPDGLPTKKTINVGSYKTSPNHVKTVTGEIFRFATPEETPVKMHDLVKSYNEKSKEEGVNPIILAARFHYDYIRIHPFDDGNGRTARILMNFILLSFKYPPVIVKTEDKHNYFAALRQADAGLLPEFIDYIGSNLEESLKIMISGAKGESVEDEDDIDKELALLEQEVRASSQLGVKRQKKILEQFYKSTVLPLFLNFENKSEKMTRFYYTHDKTFCLNGMELNGIDELFVNEMFSNSLSIDFNFTMTSTYQMFNQRGFGNFNFSSNITIDCTSTEYVFKTLGGKTLKRLYGEQLNPNEINELVNLEIRRHKDFIQSKLKEYQSKTQEE